MFIVYLVLCALSVSALPFNAAPQNVVTVPPNCPEGQELVNGECRDIWRSLSIAKPELLGDKGNLRNTITVPPNCPPGQILINGQCRNVWRNGQSIEVAVSPNNMVTVPTFCPPGQQLVNGQCRDIWRDLVTESKLQKIIKNAMSRLTKQAKNENEVPAVEVSEDGLRNIISVPNQCPVGYRPDALGICRRVFDK